MTWECEFCKKEFNNYIDVCRHLRQCEKRPIEYNNYYQKVVYDEDTPCSDCVHFDTFTDEFPCNMCTALKAHSVKLSRKFAEDKEETAK